jgi:hypothetical protein
MDDRGANIDIVFRNGLKDFEVLPPPEAWDNIRPVLKVKQKPFLLLRAAALIAVLMTMSFFAYRWSREIPSEPDNYVLALNEEVVSPGIFPSIDQPLKIAVEESIPPGKISKSQIIVIENIPENVIQPEREKDSSPEVAYLKETNSYSINNSKSYDGLSLASFNSSQKIVFNLEESNQQYLPETSTLNSTDRWSIAAMASPTYYSRFNSGRDELSKQMMASEQPLISYSGGVAFSYQVNKRFSIQSGLYYSSLGQDLEGINSFGGFQKYDYTKGGRNFEVLTTSGTIYTNNPDVFLSANGMGDKVLTNYNNDVFDPEKASLQYINNTIRQTFSYLELPVVVRYKVVDKMIGVNLIGGVSYNMLVQNSVYTVTASGKYPIGKTEGLNPVSLSSSLGMGMEYSFSDKLSLNLEPTFRYYLNPFSESAGSKFHPYSFGIFSGISYKF